MRLLIGDRGLLWLYGVVMLMVAVLMPAVVIIPLLVRDDFGGGVNHVAIMESIGGIGMLLGRALISVITIPWRRITVVLVTFALSCAAIALMGLAPGTMFWLAVVWNIPVDR